MSYVIVFLFGCLIGFVANSNALLRWLKKLEAKIDKKIDEE